MVRKKISRKKWAGKKIIVGEKKTGIFFVHLVSGMEILG